jgi:hypothetical protein
VATKLDIFETLAAIDAHKLNWLSERTVDEKKGFAPPVVLRWASSIQSNPDLAEWYLEAVNTRVNVGFWDISTDTDLQYRLLASCGMGIRARHEWLGGVGKIAKYENLLNFLRVWYEDARDDELDFVIMSLDLAKFKVMIEDAALLDDDAKRLIGEFSLYRGEVEIEKTKKNTNTTAKRK